MLSPTFLRSKVARRMTLLFVLCALVPITALATISFRHVTAQLHDQAQKRLRQASKAMGMALYERLTLLESELKLVATQFEEASRKAGAEAVVNADLSKRLTGIAVVRAGTIEPLHGRMSQVPNLTPQQRRHVDAGKTLLWVGSGSDGSTKVFLSRWLYADEINRGLLLAEVNPAFLWLGGEGVTLPTMTDLCVFDETLVALYCSFDETATLQQRLPALVGQSEASFFEWQGSEQEYLSSYWNVPLRFQFSPAQWTVVLSESKQGALAPMANFKYTFAMVILLALCAVTLLSLNQIRHSLTPLEALRAGTSRIANREFSSRVSITSQDEFGELGRSFNTMAERLGKQFQMLETMSAISRAILSSYDSRGIVEVVQSRISDAVTCDAVSLAILGDSEAAGGTMSTRLFTGSERQIEYPFRLNGSDAALLAAHPDHVEVDGASVPHVLGRIAENGFAKFLVFPIMIQQSCAGFLALGYAGSASPAQDDLTHARQLADQVSVALSNLREITKRIQADAQAHFLEHYDPLTRLANRKLFHQTIAVALASFAPVKKPGAVLLVNLDRFQRVNDTFGPRAGDGLLQEVAGRIERCLRKDRALIDASMMGRLDADQFGVLLADLSSESESIKVGQSLLDVIGQPYDIGGSQVFLTASVGIALLHQDGEDPDLLIRNADTAMRAAKEKGRNLCQFYSESMNRRLAERMALEAQIRTALERAEFVLYYQPQVDVRSGAIVGVEALIRWRHPGRGVVAPSDFVPVVEEDEQLIVAMGEWAIRTACTQQQAWQKAGLPPLDIAVNVSALHFRRTDFVERLEAMLRETGADRRYLELELTETVLMNDSQSAVATLKRLRSMGIRLAMDDFGTGYSSLAYLKQFPVDKLKIDRAFVNGIAAGSDGAAITSAIIAMGHALNLQVLAEGVETPEQLAFLRERGCHTYQGYLFSRPLSSADVTDLFRRRLGPRLAESA